MTNTELRRAEIFMLLHRLMTRRIRCVISARLLLIRDLNSYVQTSLFKILVR